MNKRWKKFGIITLLSASLIPLATSAKKEETLAERKTRIMRKYLREKVEVIEGEPFVFELTEEEIALENERRRQDRELDIESREASPFGLQMTQRQRPRPIQRPQQESLFGNSLSTKDEEGKTESGWPTANDWQGERASPFGFGNRNEQEKSSSPAQDNSYWGSKEEDARGIYKPRNFGFGGTPVEQKESTYQIPPSGVGFGRQDNTITDKSRSQIETSTRLENQNINTPSPFRYSQPTENNASGSSYYQPGSSYYQPGSPFNRTPTSPSSSTYKSPYQNNQQQTWQRNSTPRQQNQSFRQFYDQKEKSPSYNPAAIDSYADELMKRSKNR